jgi:K+-sensing histidine kinase KdpD
LTLVKRLAKGSKHTIRIFADAASMLHAQAKLSVAVDCKELVMGYRVAVVGIVVAIFARRLLDPYLGWQFAFATVFFAVLLTAWLGGFGPAIVAVALGAIGAAYFLLPPRADAVISDLPDQNHQPARGGRCAVRGG